MTDSTKKKLALFISLCMAFSLIASASSVEATSVDIHVARVITLASIVGDSIALSNGGPRTFTPREGQRLTSGSVVSTGEETFAHLRMDTASTLQMDEQSQVIVTSTGRHLTLTLQSGNALVHVPNQVSERYVECRVGAVRVAVLGTMLTMERGYMDIVTISMLSGYVEVHVGGIEEVVTLPAGHMMWVFDNNHLPEDVFDLAMVTHYDWDDGHALVTTMVPEYMSFFTLQSVYDNQEYLLDIGTITQEMLDDIAQRLATSEEGNPVHSGSIVLEHGTVPVIIPPPVTPTPTPTPTPVPTPPPPSSPGGISFSVDAAAIPPLCQNDAGVSLLTYCAITKDEEYVFLMRF